MTGDPAHKREKMTAYYNEIDPYAAQWLRNLIEAGHISPGDVDERSIVDVQPDDLRGYTQCHFFAGIGGWSYALRLAGWPDDRHVWTGSCPCQPFSAAGQRKGGSDERHLWPYWFPLIRECRPAIVFGEQVEGAIGWGWLDAVFADLEGEGYATGAAVLPACGVGESASVIDDNARCLTCGRNWDYCECVLPGPFAGQEKITVGAPHIRQRLWFVANDPQQRCGQGYPLAGKAERERERDARTARTCRASP